MSQALSPAIAWESDIYEELVLEHETITRADSGITIIETTFELSSMFNGRIIVKTSFIAKKIMDDNGVTDSTPLDSIAKTGNIPYYLSSRLKYIEGKPNIESGKLYFKSDDGKTNKEFIINFADKGKKEIESLKEAGTDLIWKKSEAPEPVISIGF